MPATYTHHLFTKDVYKSLDIQIQNKLDYNLFLLFGKSFDALFFYKSHLGTFAHQNHANLYFQNIIKYIRQYQLNQNPQVLAYLYGSICHYVLDSTVHPFIYYYGGKYDKNDKKAKKYLGKHDYIESMIDAILAKERMMKPIYKCHIGKDIFPRLTFSSDLKKIIDFVYDDTFKVKSGSKIYIRSYKNYRFIFKHGMLSRWGIKKLFYILIDWFHFLPIKLQNFCYYIPKLDVQVLNLDHKKWVYPVDKKISYHYSFYDLYDVAIVKAIKLITLLDQSIDKDEKTIRKALKEVGNLHYGTGVNENRSVTMKYFAN